VTKEVAVGLAPLGVVSLEAPVSGGVAGAKAGTLTIMVSGDAVAYETVRPALLEIDWNTVLVGDEVGQGQTLQLINNRMAAANYAVASRDLRGQGGAEHGVQFRLPFGAYEQRYPPRARRGRDAEDADVPL
jgi:3-hydroxyisobutyrate dehydrogenase-like beta-hydroxyacid dehydrogenase